MTPRRHINTDCHQPIPVSVLMGTNPQGPDQPLFVPATVQCFTHGLFSLVVSRETALAHRVSLAGIHLAYAPTGCSPTQETGSFVVFHFPLTHCGTTIQVGMGAVGWRPALPLGRASPAVSSHR